MGNFQERSRIIIKDSGLSQNDVAKQIEVGPSTISGWLKGQYEPNSENIFRLARLFRVTEAWLLGYASERNEFPTNISKKLIVEAPIVNTPVELLKKDYSRHEEKVEVPNKFSKYGKDLFAVRVLGESMNKLMPNNSIAICVKPHEGPQSQDIVVFREDNEFTIKRYIRTEQMIIFEPVSLNKNFMSVVYDINEEINIEVLGIVKYNFTYFD